ncbi:MULTISPECIES: A/G-specific adenine glycosylase [unclassified Neisseria]|uniref:A/G-specific adenine glycosylase n=1 Tax=unclassified Neisseria TaxID=2623750 RepID=UPI001072ACE0|nr:MULTISPECIES: A/G-specific adenine glycosylase [unclassified Neisseria]MBF0804419.1 A/G-specific adenine glycosylase [Neisseria sp. 19428wB4_WF04]TFU42804.1 A/G-specific adenine glycosylase [Neisseria sp. WF04]
MTDLSFATRLIRWQKQHGRHHLPWQVRDPYLVWLSEIMLQQTQVATVLDYYPRFTARFPTVAELAAAGQDEVLGLWAGLGYYSRARNLHKAARQVVETFGGVFPCEREKLETLCGVGRSTAAAIAAFAFHKREAILDGNVRRVLCRVFALDGGAADKKFEKQLWTLAESLLPERGGDMPAYTQGLMDLGATVCKRSKPLCGDCPMAGICRAKAQNLTAELPRKKSAPEVPTLPLFWLVMRRPNGAIWLEKRPPEGIWGGLYCVPCFNSPGSLYAAAAHFGLLSDGLEEQPAFTHRLTHRLLLITPFCAPVPDSLPGGLSDGLWADPHDSGCGLPKPLHDFLLSRRLGKKTARP